MYNYLRIISISKGRGGNGDFLYFLLQTRHSLHLLHSYVEKQIYIILFPPMRSINNII